MTVAVIGAGNIGPRVARRLAEGGVDVLLAAQDSGHVVLVAKSIGNGVRAVAVSDAVANSDQVVFATWFATTKDLLAEYKAQLAGKIVIDPSNNMAVDESGERQQSQSRRCVCSAAACSACSARRVVCRQGVRHVVRRHARRNSY